LSGCQPRLQQTSVLAVAKLCEIGTGNAKHTEAPGAMTSVAAPVQFSPYDAVW
jgi:hypothetical protein